MTKLNVLTRNFIREMVRDRTVTLIFFSAIALVVLSSFLGALSLDERRRILVHMGFAAIHWTCFGLVIFQGAFTLQREIERQTCLMVLARPLSRSLFLLGKFLSIALLALAHLVLSGILLFALLGFKENLGYFSAVLAGIFFENLILLAFVLFLSQWVRSIVATLGGIGLFLVGNWLEELRFLSQKSKDEGLEAISQVFQYIFPNFYLLNFRSERFLELGQPDLNVSLLVLHFGLWLCFFLLIATRSFSRRDLV